MTDKAAGAGVPGRLEGAALRSGRDWARWLEQSRAAQPFGSQCRPGGHLPAAWAALVHLARREGFAAGRGECPGGASINWNDRRIRICRDAAAESAVIALAHQLAHVLLHADAAYLNRSGVLPCCGIRRAEADSVTYLVAAHLGVRAPVITFAPPRTWAGTSPTDHPVQIARAVADRVLAATGTITARLDAALSPPAPVGTPDCGPGASETGLGPPHTGRGDVTRQRHAAPATLRCVPPGLPPRRGTAATVAASAGGSGARPAVSDDQLIRVLRAAAGFFRARLPSGWVPGYLERRGFSASVQRQWQAGYAPPGWDTLTRHLLALGYPAAVIEAAGIAHRSPRGGLADTFRDRAILPIGDPDGRIIAFIGRAPGSAGPDVPKYLNSRGTALYRKREVLFGLWEARRLLAQGARPVVTEGPFDAVAVTIAGGGRFAGVAPCGTALTTAQAAVLGRFCEPRTVGAVVAFDADPAGRKAAIAAYHLLAPHTAALTAACLPTGCDPAQVLRDHGPAALARALAAASPLADLVVNAAVDGWSRWLRYPEGQFNALRSAAPVVAAMPPSQVARQAGRLAGRLGLDHATVTEAVTGAVADVVDGPAVASRPGDLRAT